MLLVSDMKECSGKSDDEVLNYLKNKCGILKYEDCLMRIMETTTQICRLFEENQVAFKNTVNKAIQKKTTAMAGKKNLKPEEIVQALKNAEKEVQKDIADLEKQVSDITGYQDLLRQYEEKNVYQGLQAIQW